MESPVDIEELLKTRKRIRLTDGRKLCYTLYGHPFNSPEPPKKVALYFHGWPTSRIEPALLHEAAVKQDIRIVAIDRPGYGHSTFNPRGHFHTIAADVVQLIDHLGLSKVVVIGTSGGSPFASACASLLPDRVEALLLICPLTPMFGREEELQQGLSPASKRIFTTFRLAPWAARVKVAALRQVMYLPQHSAGLKAGGFGPEDLEAMQNNLPKRLIMQAAIREGLRQGIRGPFRDMMLYVTRPWKVVIEDIRCPTTIWIGDRDIITPECMARHYHSRIPGSRLHVVPQEGHLSLPFFHATPILASLFQPSSRL